MTIANATANQLEKGQEITCTHVEYISNKGIVSETIEVDTLRIVSIRKSIKSKSGLRVKVEIIKGSSSGSGFTIVDFEHPAVNFGTIL